MSVEIESLLIFLSFLFLILEIFFASGGIFTFVGLTSFIIGTYFLYLSMHELPGVFLYVIMPLFFATLVFVTAMIVLGLKAQRTSIKTKENLVGKSGICIKDITKQSPGQIEIEGEIWAAYSDQEIKSGQKVKVIKQESLKLFVTKEE